MMFGAMPAVSAMAPQALQQMPQAKPRAGMFGSSGKGNIGEIISAALSGYLAAQGNPAGQMGLQALHQRRQQAAEQEQYGQRREDDFQDWVRKQAYQAANPSPVNNDTVADYNFIAQQLGEEEGRNFLRNRANPPQLMNIPGIGIVQIPRNGAPQQGAPAAPGVTFTPLDEGGPTPPASGNFRFPF